MRRGSQFRSRADRDQRSSNGTLFSRRDARSDEYEIVGHQRSFVDVLERQDVGAVEGDDRVGPDLALERGECGEVRNSEAAQIAISVPAMERCLAAATPAQTNMKSSATSVPELTFLSVRTSATVSAPRAQGSPIRQPESAQIDTIGIRAWRISQ